MMIKERLNLMKMKKRAKHILQCLILCGIVFFAFGAPADGSGHVQAAGETNQKIYEINDFTDFFILAQSSKGYNYQGMTVKLNKDIDLTNVDIQKILDDNGVTHLTIGTKDVPFAGTFDGQHHKIQGLVYKPGIIKDPNSGLFSFTDGATIKNLTLKDSSIECVYQGGNIVGHAKNTHLENLTVLNSKLKISPANNVLSLITNLGFCGGGIAGIMENSTMYNCELSGSEVVNNNTSGITGVGGEGLYMGGLVGWAENSVIEYSRVRANYVGETEKELRQSTVRNDYDIAVGALGGKSVYAGGIVGGVNTAGEGETRIIDCFSTADVSFYAANYVAVGSGIAGYAGGITGALRGNSHIERCHYAGNIHSKQYNAILVIPIIQTDVNISGVSHINKDSTTVTNSYFKRSSSATKKNIYAVGTRNDTDSYAAKTDDVYIDPEFWKSKDYDLIGTTARNSKNDTYVGQGHVNKWVMDYDLGIPVHGSSVYGAFDFPGAATVSISETALVNQPVKTEDAYQFAVQGIHPRGDQTVTLNVTPKDVNEEEDEYKFFGWYLKPDKVDTDHVDDIKQLEAVTHAPDAKPVVDQPELQLTFELNDIDRNLYIACMKAKVQFYDVEGTELKDNTDHYTYQQGLAEVKPELQDAEFYGWTTEPNVVDGVNKGYPAITADKLAELETNGKVYQTGDPVEEPMKLYPIYKTNITDIQTIFEGNEHDNSELVSLRKGVGETSVGTENGTAFINVTGYGEGGAFPEGYRFLGWYEKITGADGTKQEVRVSKDQKYYVTDLTKAHIYTARFEYRVQYYVNLKDADLAEGHKYDYWNFYTDWVGYNTEFNGTYAQAIMPIDYEHEFNHWSFVNNGDQSCGDNSDQVPEKYKIMKPENVYGHWTGSGSYKIVIYSDFPNAAKLWTEGKASLGNLTFYAEPYPGYEFVFWAEESDEHVPPKEADFWCSKQGENRWNPGGIYPTTRFYRVKAHLAAAVNFHFKNNETITTVKRRYNDPVIMETNTFANYTFPFSPENSDNPNDIIPVDKYGAAQLLREGSPKDADMNILDENGNIQYEFLGWIQGKDANATSPVIRGGIPIGGSEWNNIYDVAEDSYCTSDASKALPYILPADAKVTETMDLYPVYVKYDVTTTTNIAELTTTPEGINIPTNPEYTLDYVEGPDGADQKGVAKVTVTAHHNVEKVRNDKQEDQTMYQLMGMKCYVSDGRVVNLWDQGTLNPEGNAYTFEMNIDGGKAYKFVAIYNPVFLVYHTDAQATHLETRNVGQKVGTMPKPNFESLTEPAYMVGWTDAAPGEGAWYHMYSSEDEAVKVNMITPQDKVEKSMEMWPVFVKVNVTVNSNIDDQLTDPNTVRYLENRENQFVAVAKDYPGYVFKGWNTGYVDETTPGTEVATTTEYVIPKNELFSGKTFTAIYEQSFDIRYHDFQGEVLFTAKTTKEAGRSFVEKVEIAGNPEKVEVPIDAEAFALIQNKVDAMAAEKQTNVRFVEWRLEETKADNLKNYIGWADFKDKVIGKDLAADPNIAGLDLYPVAYEVGFYHPHATDPNKPGNVYDGMEYSVNKRENGEKGIDAVFTTEYSDDRVFISTKEFTVEDSKPVERGLEKIHTEVYMEGLPDKDGNISYVSACDGNVDTNPDGLAMHRLHGVLGIQKKYPQGTATGETVLINIQKLDENNTPVGNVMTVPITIDENGVGSAQFRMPLGKYQITEDQKWTWRDNLTAITVNDKDATKLENGVQLNINVLSSKLVEFENQRQNQKWFSDVFGMKNVFKTN